MSPQVYTNPAAVMAYSDFKRRIFFFIVTFCIRAQNDNKKLLLLLNYPCSSVHFLLNI